MSFFRRQPMSNLKEIMKYFNWNNKFSYDDFPSATDQRSQLMIMKKEKRISIVM